VFEAAEFPEFHDERWTSSVSTAPRVKVGEVVVEDGVVAAVSSKSGWRHGRRSLLGGGRTAARHGWCGPVERWLAAVGGALTVVDMGNSLRGSEECSAGVQACMGLDF